MHKILVLTDLHVTKAGQKIIGLDPAQRLTGVLQQALTDHPDAKRLILTGDLTHFGSREEYARLKELLADVPIPISMTLGNHDRREGFRAIFPDGLDAGGFAQEVIDLPAWRLIMLDTNEDDPSVKHAGVLCPARMTFLEDALIQAGHRRTLVLMHHPPFKTGFVGMDAIRLRNDTEAHALMVKHGVTLCVSGHVHRTIGGNVGGLPFMMFKSPCHQMPMLLNDPGSAHSVDEPGAYGLLLLDETGVVAHSEDHLPNRVATLDGHST